MIDHDLYQLAATLGAALAERGDWLATAESCTGGLVAATVTAVPGSSGWFERGFATYSNQAKIDLLGVNPQTLAAHGAVSEAVVREMATGALAKVPTATLALATTGVAGPGGGTLAKPVGTVCFGLARRVANGEQVVSFTRHLDGDRAQVRRDAVAVALGELLAWLQRAPPAEIY